MEWLASKGACNIVWDLAAYMPKVVLCAVDWCNMHVQKVLGTQALPRWCGSDIVLLAVCQNAVENGSRMGRCNRDATLQLAGETGQK